MAASASDNPAIEVTDLECGYDGKVLLENVTFTVARGEIFFVIGASGSGKSTLLRNLIGLNRPTEGAVKFFGTSFLDADQPTRREVLKTFGVLYQSGALWTSLTLSQNVALPLQIYTELGAKEINDLAMVKLEQVGLSGFEHYFPAEISGGMKKRAGLARALALDPSIVFFDEPSAGLDPITSRDIDELILSIRDSLGTTCVVVSHELDSIFRVGDRLVMLDKTARGIIAEGTPDELRNSSEDVRVREFLRRDDAKRSAPFNSPLNTRSRGI